ncbi:uncharacterized protein EV420DRAFT_1658541 [Desarmillaria tabescens]|uniref:Uncharacterized protein n=1 Tax=Armillaria tabescens TaxID=1929756 RepID=A0AA39TXC9_ARMTA|nr:uncharacterized protein EV420DRAFT_1658541 [Desarmillaria tabescens]KAK0469168.1 hypothetical protein EV420DRAFT_1658541 [Desarmillaria tabescens]
MTSTIKMIRAIDVVKQRLPNLPRTDALSTGYMRLDEDSASSTAATELPKAFETFMTEEHHLLVSAADVNHVSTLYLIHHVNLIIARVLDEKGLGTRSLRCCSPSQDSDRPDLVWQFSLDGHRFCDLFQLKYKAIQTKALPIVQQATEYGCGVSSSGVVAVFDYDGMVALDFKLGGEMYDNKVNPVKYLFCSSNDDNWTFCQLLLAVIIYCFHKKGILDSDAHEVTILDGDGTGLSDGYLPGGIDGHELCSIVVMASLEQ